MTPKSPWDSGPPGWLAQWLVTLSVLAIVFLAGSGVGEFRELMAESGEWIVALIPVSLTPWLGARTLSKFTRKPPTDKYTI